MWSYIHVRAVFHFWLTRDLIPPCIFLVIIFLYTYVAALRGPWPIQASVAGLTPIDFDLYGDEFPPSCGYVAT